MRRVLVIGSGGAGKTTFARELAAASRLPLVHLDHHYWRRGWVPTPPREWEEVVARLVAGDEWVLDGNYAGTLALRLARADTAVFLDVSRLVCLARVVRRAARRREEVAPGCPHRLTAEFLRWIWTYPAGRRPAVLERLAEFERAGGRVAVLRSRSELARFVAAARTAAAGHGGAVSIARDVSERRERDGL